MYKYKKNHFIFLYFSISEELVKCEW